MFSLLIALLMFAVVGFVILATIVLVIKVAFNVALLPLKLLLLPLKLLVLPIVAVIVFVKLVVLLSVGLVILAVLIPILLVVAIFAAPFLLLGAIAS